jgi:hypothetical protein
MIMKRLLRIFALLTAASMLIWIAGCGGDDEEEEKGPPPEVNAVSITEGAEVAGNSAITISFSKAMESVDVTVTGASGAVVVDGKTATWTPSPDIPPGAHTLTGTGTDKEGQSVDFGPVNFSAIAPDNEPPALDGGACDPKDGATGVDPAGYGESIVIALKDNVGVADAKVTATEPEFNFTEELADGKLTVNFLKYSMPNETEFSITVSASDAAGNTAEVTYGFTTMAKEQ